MYWRFDNWQELQKFLAENEKARIVAEPYLGNAYNNHWIVFIPKMVC